MPFDYLKLVLLMIVSSMHLQTLIHCAPSNCSGDEFNCGAIAYISYPFWGGSRPPECGKAGFQMVCQGGVPILNISSLSYRVLQIKFESNTLIIARQDLLSSNRCPKILVNTTIDQRLFKIPPTSTDQTLALYYHCSGSGSGSGSQLPNQFHCGDDATVNLFYADSSTPEHGISCSNSIRVPINEDDARSLQFPTAASINSLQHALTSGFSISWYPDPKQYSTDYCNKDVDGNCILSARPCTYADRCSRTDDAEAPAPNHQDNHLPNQPVSPPNYQQPGHGMPPAQNTGHPTWNVAPPQTGNGFNARKNSSNKVVEVAVVPLCVAAVAITSIIILCFIKLRQSANGHNQESNQYVEKFLLQHGSLTPKRYKYSEIKKITKSFSDQLGQGGYGSVYKGMLPDGCPVAVKVLKETDGSNGEEFINEVASISKTSHVNIVSLLGFCSEGSKRALVYEYMPNRSLDKFLCNKRSADGTDCSLDMKNLYKIAVGIAKGLEYLHTGCSTRIVHFDIKPQNILLDEDMCPKISDFGLAKLCNRKKSVLSVLGTRGTIGYIAPEVFSRNFGGVSHKSDVYSYGMMLLEMVGEINIVLTQEGTASSENYFPDRLYEQVVLDFTKKKDDFMIEEEEEEIMRKKMLVIGFWCIQTIPSDRPSMSRVGEMLEGSVQSIQIPPKPVLCTPNLPNQQISSASTAHVDTVNSDQDFIQLSISIE